MHLLLRPLRVVPLELEEELLKADEI